MPHWKHLCEDIGERRAGSAAEHRAARYLQEQFESYGLTHSRLEAFPCTWAKRADARVQVKLGGRWREVSCSVLVGSPSTNRGRKFTEYDLVWLELPEQSGKLKKNSLKGKAALMFGPLSTDTDGYRALVDSRPAVILWVDDRLPFEWVKSDGMIPEWCRLHGARPTIGVPYRDAYTWRLKGVRKVRAWLHSEMEASTSFNVVADLPGQRSDAPMVVFGSHYDTQLGNPGADDNASGTVSVLALAKAFAQRFKSKPPKRGLRFISFGTEEQLSVGAKCYVDAHRSEMKRHALMVNLDSISSALGHTQMVVGGDAQLQAWGTRLMRRQGVLAHPVDVVTPFADHFPFTVFGVPALFFCRTNCPGNRWQHHSVHDNMSTVSPQVVCELANAVYGLASEAATVNRLPFRRGIPRQNKAEVMRLAREMFWPNLKL